MKIQRFLEFLNLNLYTRFIKYMLLFLLIVIACIIISAPCIIAILNSSVAWLILYIPIGSFLLAFSETYF